MILIISYFILNLTVAVMLYNFEKYSEELQEIERELDDSIYREFHQPPTEEEYNRLWEEWYR